MKVALKLMPGTLALANAITAQNYTVLCEKEKSLNEFKSQIIEFATALPDANKSLIFTLTLSALSQNETTRTSLEVQDTDPNAAGSALATLKRLGVRAAAASARNPKTFVCIGHLVTVRAAYVLVPLDSSIAFNVGIAASPKEAIEKHGVPNTPYRVSISSIEPVDLGVYAVVPQGTDNTQSSLVFGTGEPISQMLEII